MYPPPTPLTPRRRPRHSYANSKPKGPRAQPQQRGQQQHTPLSQEPPRRSGSGSDRDRDRDRDDSSGGYRRDTREHRDGYREEYEDSERGDDDAIFRRADQVSMSFE